MSSWQFWLETAGKSSTKIHDGRSERLVNKCIFVEYLMSTIYTIYTVVLCGMSTTYKEYDSSPCLKNK